MSEFPVLDMSSVEKLRELPGSETGTLFHELSNIMQQESPKTTDQIEKAKSSMDRDSLYRVVHRLKGSALYVGGAKLGNLCQKFLATVKEADDSTIQTMLEDIKKSHVELLDALKEEVERGG